MNELKFRIAEYKDLFEIIELLHNDILGAKRESHKLPIDSCYLRAFKEVSKDPNQELLVVEQDNEIVGSFQLSFIPGLTFKGGLRVQVEGVRVKYSKRGSGLGKLMFKYIIDRAKEREAVMIQLTTNNKRTDALNFYQSIGFSATHYGMKLYLN